MAWAMDDGLDDEAGHGLWADRMGERRRQESGLVMEVVKARRDAQDHKVIDAECRLGLYTRIGREDHKAFRRSLETVERCP